jgi:hypothetical protein
MDTIFGAVEAELVSKKAVPRPRFILEVTPDFRIRDTNVPAVAQDLERDGFGIISYTWGRFQDKTTYEDSPNAPKFDAIDADGLPDRIRWYIPKLKGAFTINDVRGVIQKLGMKYVWWHASPTWGTTVRHSANRRTGTGLAFPSTGIARTRPSPAAARQSTRSGPPKSSETSQIDTRPLPPRRLPSSFTSTPWPRRASSGCMTWNGRALGTPSAKRRLSR